MNCNNELEVSRFGFCNCNYSGFGFEFIIQNSGRDKESHDEVGALLVHSRLKEVRSRDTPDGAGTPAQKRDC